MFPQVDWTTFSPDGVQLAVGPVEGAIEVLDARSLVPVGSYVFEEMGAGVRLRLQPRWPLDGRRWPGRDRACLGRRLGRAPPLDVRAHGRAWAVAWADDSEHLVTGSSDGVAIVWDVGGDGYRRELSFASQDLPGGIWGAAFEPGGTRILLGGLEIAKVWESGREGDAELANLLTGEEWPPIAFTADETLAAGGAEGGLIEYDTMTGAERRSDRAR